MGAALPRAPVVAVLGLLALLAAVVLDIFQGQGGIPTGTVLDALFSNDAANADHSLVLDVRLPRAMAGVVAGGALAASAVLLQSITRNPLAEPATLGLTAGGALAVTVVAGYATIAPGTPTIAVAFVGVALAALLIGALAAGAGGGSVRLVLAGMAVTLALGAATAAIQLARENETSGLFLWGAGSLLQLGWTQVQAGMIIGVIALAAGLLVSRALDVAALGEGTARALGLRAGTIRFTALVLAAVLAAVAVGVAGPIAFAGILAVGIARWARPRGHFGLFLIAVPWGGAVVLMADVLGRLILGVDTETPAGVVCAVLGAPVLVLVALRLKDQGAPSVDAGASHGRWRPWATVLVLAALVGAAVAGLTMGDVYVPAGEVLGALFGEGTPLGEIVLDERAPRVVTALVAGACLAASGTVLQASVRNPFAGPELVGVTGGAGVAAFIVLFLVPDAPAGAVPFAAFAGAMIALALVLLIAGVKRSSPQRLALIGLAVTACCAAITTLMVFHAQPAAAAAITWLAGSTYATEWSDVRMMLVPAAVLVPIALLSVRRLDVLMLDDDLGATLGMRVGVTRGALLAVGAALGAAAVAVVGAIAFVGLLAPHAARLVAGGNHRRLLPVAMAMGAILLSAADTLGRSVIPPNEIPSGLVVSLIGAPYLAYLMWRSRGIA
ncbi:MAG: iron ABC transporter permease [Thermoleophilia bacterium]